jgi:hypothetical protein
VRAVGGLQEAEIVDSRIGELGDDGGCVRARFSGQADTVNKRIADALGGAKGAGN